MKSYLITPEGKKTYIKPHKDKKWTVEELQFLLDGYIEPVPSETDTEDNQPYVLVNEDGYNLRLPVNSVGSLMAMTVGKSIARVIKRNFHDYS